MSSWFDEGFNLMIEEIASNACITEEKMKSIYSALTEYGLIDYDVEKEVFYRIIHGEE